MTFAWFNLYMEKVWTISPGSNLKLNSCKTRHFHFLPCYFLLRKSKEEYDEEMSRRLLLEEEVGSTSARSSCSDKPMAESGEVQITTSAPSQQSNAAKVRHHELCEPQKTLWTSQTVEPHTNTMRPFFVQAKSASNLGYKR